MAGTAPARIRRITSGGARRRFLRQLSAGPRVRMLLGSMIAAFTAWLFLPVPGLTATVPAPARTAPQPGLPWLSTEGGRIVDSLGRTVLLRGFNVDALLEPTMHPSALDATDASLMQQSGFDVVRLPIAWSQLEPQRGYFDPTYLDSITRAVAVLNAHDLYVVLDMHSLGWSPAYGGSGAPAWATVQGVPDPVWGPMPSLQRLLSPAINVSTAYFWLSSDLQGQYFDAWTFVARRFRDDSGVAGYDIINEPHSFPLPPFRFDKDQLWPFYAHAVDTIGAADPNHIFFLDNDMTGDLPTSVVPLRAPDLVYAPHVYTGSLIPPDFTGDTGALRTHVNELASEAASVPAPVWFGEFSISIDHAYSAEWIDAVLDDFNAHGAGWAWWQWRESSGYGVRSADGSSLDRRLLRLLARPFPMAAPAGVTARTAGRSADSLEIYSPATASGVMIDVSWPEYVLGTPRSTSTCGAMTTWDETTARLTVQVPGGGACTVTIRQ